MKIFYQLGVYAYYLGIRIAALTGNEKARLWLQGRKQWQQQLRSILENNQKPVVWIHASSLGEYEMAVPLIQKLTPDHLVLLSFFSPSGYEVVKDKHPHCIYLPLNTRSNAMVFLELAKPVKAVFVKYDLWYHYLHQLSKQKVPTYIITALFRKGHWYFSAWGRFMLKELKKLTHIFTISQASVYLLQEHDVHAVSVAGDTRCDRVLQNVQHPFEDEKINAFISGKEKIIVCGSTWPEDEQLLIALQKKEKYTWIIAPHDISTSHIQSLKERSGGILYSEYQPGQQTNVLIIDSIGMLKYLYRYAWVTYVGGAFRQGLHNVLEPAAYGKPVLFGPQINKYPEAISLLNEEAGFPVRDVTELGEILEKLEDGNIYAESAAAARRLILQNEGATEKIYRILSI